MIFGLLIWVEAWGAVATGWVEKAFVQPKITFPFMAFSWLHPLPGDGMYYYYFLMGIFGLLVMTGLFYRVAISMYTVMWAGVYFMQKTNYNNHYYLLLLLLFLMCLVPAHRYASLDVKLKPALRKLSCPQWCIWIFAFQVGVVYTYGAIAKMYPDWISMKPIETWFYAKRHLAVIGPLLQYKWMHYFITFGGILYDLLITPALLWKKTRKWAFGASIFFHLFNSYVFKVGIFPYMGISWALFFFPPESIRKIFLRKKPPFEIPSEVPSRLNPSQRIITCGLFVYAIFQIAIPLRHHLYEGDVHWTEEGHRMSWQMMTRNKQGKVQFTAHDPDSDKSWVIDISASLTYKQSVAVATRPDMCWQYIQLLKADFANKGYPHIEIYAQSRVTLNGDPMGVLYDPKVDLTKVEWEPFKHASWLLPRNTNAPPALPSFPPNVRHRDDDGGGDDPG